MLIKSLSLTNFRSYESASIEFGTRINVICGKNGAGKTNLVEAIHYLSLAKSFRLVEDKEMIKHGCEFAKIDSVVDDDGLQKQISIMITSSGKSISCNGKKIQKLSDLAKLTNVIVFEPKDVLFFRDSPTTRRRFLDISIAKRSPTYLEELSRYEKTLKERNELLKSTKVDEKHLSILTSELIRAAEPIVRARTRFIKEINEILGKIFQLLSMKDEEIELIYTPFVEQGDGYRNNASDAFKRSLESDLKKKTTNIGPHREDFSMTLNYHSVSISGSQGENRIAILSLILAPYFLIKESEKRPIIVLDDVMSELDANHKEKLVAFLEKLQQVFITTTQTQKIDASFYDVMNNKITRRNS
ncbi:MAG: DNA replication/repair protein RecF [Bacilli bacterium]|jgi:DNA replication and repair protein RecF